MSHVTSLAALQSRNCHMLLYLFKMQFWKTIWKLFGGKAFHGNADAQVWEIVKQIK